MRRLLVFEPRGHADMYGCHVVPPNDDGADLGVVFFHNEGYSTACGHGTIALVTWALDEGVVDRREGVNRVVVDVPSGRLETWATVEDGRVRSVRFRNVPVVRVGPRSRGRRARRRRRVRRRLLRVARERVEPPELPRLIALGREIKAALEAAHEIVHPLEPELRDVYGVIFWQDEGEEPLTQRNVDRLRRRRGRSLAVRLGTSARLALLDDDGRLPRGDELRHRSIVGSEFTGRVVGDAEVDGRPAVVTEVEGTAYRTGRAEFALDPDDPLGEGFLLR